MENFATREVLTSAKMNTLVLELNGKQDAISDLDTIRSGASAGAAASSAIAQLEAEDVKYGNGSVEDALEKIDSISTSATASEGEEIEIGNNAGSETYVKIDSEGIKAKGYFDINGNPLETGSSEFKDMMYVAAGDSITAGSGLNRDEDLISSSDPYKPVSGIAKKTYPYYIAKYNKMQWVNQGYGGSTLGDVTVAGVDKYGFSKANGRYTQLPNDVNYISIWFGWNDDYYGPIMKREDWLYSTYGSKIYWPTSVQLIGTTHTDGTPYATQSQYDACNAVTGSVGGVEYDTSSQYFEALYRGLETDTTNQTWWGAFNTVLPYLIEKYPFAKILVITGYGGTAPMWDIAIAAAKKYGVAWLDLSQPEMNFINVRNSSDEANGLVYFDANKYTDRNVYASYSSGNIPLKTFRLRTLLYDGCHPNYKGYEYLYNRIQEKLLNI